LDAVGVTWAAAQLGSAITAGILSYLLALSVVSLAAGRPEGAEAAAVRML
jgi:hypothetical protein